MNPEGIQSLFAARLYIFDPILGQPTDAGLTRLRKELKLILLPLPYNVEKGIHNLMGLVMDEDDYKVHYGANFPKITRPAVYDEDISNNATNVVRAKEEAVNTAKFVDYQLFAAAECKTRYFILAVIEYTWVRELRKPVTLYTTVSPSGLLAHLQLQFLYGVLHALDVLALKNEMQHYYNYMEGIPDYTNAL